MISAGVHSSASKPSEYTNRDHHEDFEPAIQANLKAIRKGEFKSVTNPDAQHFKKPTEPKNSAGEPIIGDTALAHPIWSQEEVYDVNITHKKPVGFIDNFAYLGVQTTRKVFDFLTGYNRTPSPSNAVWVNRLCFLETVAGVPGMVAAMVRHLESLRKMRRDHGWIHTLLEEAENERMHLMVFLQIKQPSLLFRLSVMSTQAIFVSGFSIAYLLSPKLCHRFVGYLEEEAVITYTKLLQQIEDGGMQEWKTKPASQIAINYWRLSQEATMKDVVLAIRADEAHHRVVNHTLSSMRHDDYNPYKPGE
ncbi:hypothetical protein CAPTEDRAFT_122794 [Capitella teleta]|uniref:Alternative oxidase n=1 Tax=Capitella teleta TaxID=283909 RepID=R7U3X9_CAPTE|nr:hypothetical protein CAPTEDRAFT_122794 [Capitella teleta]|eukprot:ELT97860.1 hypothetical protein CAPTEDRAFT_122794 [Capitella teleta]